MDRLAQVFFADRLAGELSQTAGEFRFQYDPAYLAGGTPLSFNLPLRDDPYVSDELFPFFDNLVSEGWLRRLQAQQQRVDESDHFGLLLLNGHDLVGAVTIAGVASGPEKA